ncbi:MAG TPA: hypothetical protein PLS53_08855 [Thermoanaerobaculaceae bacterium]|nr:hypothetical protein [Thermoanaerobaculaceae bacterium]HPS78251.1 hypothetical protein [Thermoanaerobaculaceae bacterium]
MTPDAAARRLVRSPLLHRLAAAVGDAAFLVGGALRDRLLGHPSRDVDLVVERDSAGAAHRLAVALGGHAFPLGKAPLVTWRVVAGRQQVDVWEIAGSLETDIWRRDLTVNAIFWRLPRGPLFDPTGGLADLAARRLCVVRPGNLDDDPLRVLRAVRLMSTHPTLAMTAEAERTVANAAPGLATVARERILDELHHLLAGPGVGKALAVAERLGVLANLSPAWARWPALSAISGRATSLADLQGRSRGFLRAGAAMVAPALLAAPAAGFPDSWDASRAAAALGGIGYPTRAADGIARAAGLGEALVRLQGRRADVRAVAADAADLLPAALAWAVAADPMWLTLAPGVWRWRQVFERRHRLLDGAEIAGLLGLPPGTLRAEAVRALRLAEARGEVRTQLQAERHLREWQGRRADALLPSSDRC